MRDLFHDHLFSKGLFVGAENAGHAPEALASLAKLFNIRITQNPGWASVDMVKTASRNLGEHVPPPFYLGFPESVRNLPIDVLVLDRLLHYVRTYGLDDFSTPKYSLFEEEVVRKCFDEETEVRELAIISEKEALALLQDVVGLLLASSRPLSDSQYDLVWNYWQDYGYDVVECNCKDTAVRLLIDSRDASFARCLKLSDVIRLVEQLQFQCYESTDIKKLNLRNRDRKLLTAVLDRIFEEGVCDTRTCLEKRKLWKGLLHHLHYKAKNDAAAQFLDDIRNNEARSVYSEFERLIAAGDVREAVDMLRAAKGPGAVLRNLDYLLSRCKFPATADYVLDAIQTDNKILLIQLFLHYCNYDPDERRVFAFQKNGMTIVHEETHEEQGKRKTALKSSMVSKARVRMWEDLEKACKGTLGKVYIGQGMNRIALPLQEGTSMGGVGTVPRGSRLPIPDGKKIRAFTYWELVDDIDLSAFLLSGRGEQIELSWRTFMDADSIVFSGDQTSGYEGGSEYFDIDLKLFKKEFPDMRYIVLCDNVYSGVPFSDCLCKAGYMMRDREDSGEVFEPKTVKSSYAITCPSTFAYLFGIDVETREIVWLNMARNSRERIAGETNMAFLLDYLEIAYTINLDDFARMLATEVVDDPLMADVVFSDKDEPMREGVELIRSSDIERIIELLN